MHLNIDCVRDILLTIENNEFGTHLTLGKLCENLPNYTQNEIHYACLKLYEGEYLDLNALNLMNQTMPAIKSINDLTFQGHEFLENIKNTSNWDKVKNGCKTVGSFSLPVIRTIATQLITEAIKKVF